jgi:hypothetical protein
MRIRSLVRGLLSASLVLAASVKCLAVGDVAVSQVWGGTTGTTGTATFPKADYVELFNRTGSAVSLSGWSLNISTASNTTTSWSKCDLPAVSMPAYSYFLVRVSADTTNGISLPGHDAEFPALTNGTLGTSGRVCLRSTTTPIGAVNCPTDSIIDLLAYGSTTVTCYEGTGARAPANSTTTGAIRATFRRGDGCIDTDDNGADFLQRAPSPRNAATAPRADCGDSGACCNLTTGVCGLDSSGSCTNDGLSFIGIGTSCTPSPCPASGACCSGTTTPTTCTAPLTVAGCAAISGSFYMGDNLACAASPCSSSTSCCFADGTCCTMVAALCTQQGATPGAFGVTCTGAGNCLSTTVVNDLCSGATPLTAGVMIVGNNWNATFTGDGPSVPCLTGQSLSSKGVWFTFTPPATSVYEISTCGTAFNSDMMVFSIPSCAAPNTWTVLACGDDGCPDPAIPAFCGATTGATASSRLAGFRMEAGLTYHIRVSVNGTANSNGNYRIVINDQGNAAATGACCYGLNGRCEIRTQASCADALLVPAGTYQGDNTACPTELCGTDYGACCTSSTGACQIRLTGGCSGSGNFWVEGAACDPSPCSIVALPPNGTCATAAVLTDVDLPFSAIVGMNQAPDGPAIGCSTALVTRNAVWYVYTPSTSGVVSAWELGARDTSVVIYEASPDCNALTELQCETSEDDANYPVLANHVYYILFTTPGSASTGANDFYSIRIKKGTPTVPSNDLCAGAIAISPSASLQSFPAGGAGPEDRTSCQTLTSQPPEARNGVWFTYTTGNVDVIARFQRASNPQFYSAQILTGSCGGVSEYECLNLGTSLQPVALRKNTTYYFMMHKRSGYVAYDGTYQFIFNIDSPGPPQVPNADCSTATIITLPYGEIGIDDRLAFDEPAGLLSACPSGTTPAGVGGVWYAYTPDVPTTVKVEETAGTCPPPGFSCSADTVVAAFEGSCAGTRVLCSKTDTDALGSNTFPAYPGNTYFILVAREFTGFPTGSDPLTVSITGTPIQIPPPPANDDCVTATPITTLPFSDSALIGGALADTPRAICSRGTNTTTSRGGIWYTYTNGFGPKAVVMSQTSGLDSIIAAYKGVCGGLEPVMCTDEPQGNAYLYMESFTTYYIMVAQAFDLAPIPSAALSFTMDLAPTVIPPPANDACELAKNIRTLPFNYTGLPLAARNGPYTACALPSVTQSTDPLWFSFDSGGGYTLRVWELSGEDVTYALYVDCGSFEQACTTSDGSITTPLLFTLEPNARYRLQVARQSHSDYAYGATPYQLTISVADGTPGACCTGTSCVTTVIESCAASFVPGGTCSAANPVPCCPANYNQINGLEVQDIFDFLNAWFAGETRADFNNNGILEVQDIFDFLNGWFAGC